MIHPFLPFFATFKPQPGPSFVPSPKISTHLGSLKSLFKGEKDGGSRQTPPQAFASKPSKEKKVKLPKSRTTSLENDVKKLNLFRRP